VVISILDAADGLRLALVCLISIAKFFDACRPQHLRFARALSIP